MARRARDLRVLFFGDSLLAGVGDPTGLGWVGRIVASSHTAGIAITPYNLGIRRDTSADVVERWEREACPRLDADAEMRVVLSFGANDTTIENGQVRVRPERTVANLEAVIDRAVALGLPVLVVGPAPVNDQAQRQRILDLSPRLAGAAGARGVPFVDVATAIEAHAIWREEAARGDGAHPGACGYAHLANVISAQWLAWIRAAGEPPMTSLGGD